MGADRERTGAQPPQPAAPSVARAVATPVPGEANPHRGEQVDSEVAGDADRTNAFDQNMTLGSQDIHPSARPPAPGAP